MEKEDLVIAILLILMLITTALSGIALYKVSQPDRIKVVCYITEQSSQDFASDTSLNPSDINKCIKEFKGTPYVVSVN